MAWLASNTDTWRLSRHESDLKQAFYGLNSMGKTGKGLPPPLFAVQGVLCFNDQAGINYRKWAVERWTERETTAAGGRSGLWGERSTRRLYSQQQAWTPRDSASHVSGPADGLTSTCLKFQFRSKPARQVAERCLPDSQRQTTEAKLSFSKMLLDISKLSRYNFKICKWQEWNQIISPLFKLDQKRNKFCRGFI